MVQRRSKATARDSEETPSVILPPGTPEWVTVALVEQTLEVWQPRYESPLSIEDAIRILVGASRLFRTLAADELAMPSKAVRNGDDSVGP
ncbi:hypothetical protein [Planctomicrobium sp. SH664]|uniref:hypothetical protein n=1 Tax=Planctomicrobium sp. SH664 TaxID=3448125 RepID=UPI003F5BBF79